MFKLHALCLAALAVAPTALAGEKESITPEGSRTFADAFGLSPALRAGDFIFFSGVVASLPKGAATPADAGTLAAAYERAFAALGETLAAAGADWDDIAEMTTYHTDLPAQGETFIAAKSRYIKAPFPAWTAIDVDRLWPDNGVTEIKIVVYAPREPRD